MSDNVNMLCNVSGNVFRTPPQGSITLGDPFKKRRSCFRETPNFGQ